MKKYEPERVPLDTLYLNRVVDEVILGAIQNGLSKAEAKKEANRRLGYDLQSKAGKRKILNRVDYRISKLWK